MSLSLDSHSAVRLEKGTRRKKRQRDWGRGGKKEEGGRLILLLSEFILGRSHFQVKCNVSSPSSSLTEPP